ncbi:hypothetical protein ACP70R_025685 [Stipagrostis hirtigluma subsp. patula]
MSCISFVSKDHVFQVEIIVRATRRSYHFEAVPVRQSLELKF